MSGLTTDTVDRGRTALLKQRASELQDTYRAVEYFRGPTYSPGGTITGSPTRTRSIGDALAELAATLTDSIGEVDVVLDISSDPRPLDVERLGRLRKIGRAEGSDLSAWYATMLDETD